MKVAIVGLASDSRLGIPWDDKSWELWGLPWDSEGWPRFHRTFEIHEDFKSIDDYGMSEKAYVERLEQCSGLYMTVPSVPNAKRYPIEDVSASTTEYLESSIAYLMALAIHEGAEEIGVWGVHMEAGDEYGYQKPNMEYLIGLARGRGIKVYIHPSSPLCKPSGYFAKYPNRYGWTG